MQNICLILCEQKKTYLLKTLKTLLSENLKVSIDIFKKCRQLLAIHRCRICVFKTRSYFFSDNNNKLISLFPGQSCLYSCLYSWINNTHHQQRIHTSKTYILKGCLELVGFPCYSDCVSFIFSSFICLSLR